MNERFAADPSCFRNSAELQAVLQYFGIHTGRYLLSYPDDWEQRLVNIPQLMSPLESARVSTLLRRAKERYGVIPAPFLMWMDHLSWSDNANKLTTQAPPNLDGAIVPNDTARIPLKGTILEKFELPPTAEERIASTPAEYVRVSQQILSTSHELVLVDPYLNVCDKYVSNVLEAILAFAAKGKCRAVLCFARERDILSASITRDRLKKTLQDLRSTAAPDSPIKLTYYLIDDSTSRDRMHDRYLMSVKGGIQYSQGFQQQRRDAKVTATPMSPTLHREIWSNFMDRRTDMRFGTPVTAP
jgi:hypothetical protein